MPLVAYILMMIVPVGGIQKRKRGNVDKRLQYSWKCPICGNEIGTEACPHMADDIVNWNHTQKSRDQEDDRIRMIVRQEIAEYDRYGYSPLKEWGYED